ncbi:MAG: hypothetical protein AVDCRST_MAG02-3945, partial [uncultured Rubrobacteraceae bacterium]
GASGATARGDQRPRRGGRPARAALGGRRGPVRLRGQRGGVRDHRPPGDVGGARVGWQDREPRRRHAEHRDAAARGFAARRAGRRAFGVRCLESRAGGDGPGRQGFGRPRRRAPRLLRGQRRDPRASGLYRGAVRLRGGGQLRGRDGGERHGLPAARRQDTGRGGGPGRDLRRPLPAPRGLQGNVSGRSEVAPDGRHRAVLDDARGPRRDRRPGPRPRRGGRLPARGRLPVRPEGDPRTRRGARDPPTSAPRVVHARCHGRGLRALRRLHVPRRPPPAHRLVL